MCNTEGLKVSYNEFRDISHSESLTRAQILCLGGCIFKRFQEFNLHTVFTA